MRWPSAAARRSAPSPIRNWYCASAARSPARFGIGAVFESEFGEDRRFGAIIVSDTDLAVAEYAVCLQERRRVALVRAFMDEAARLTP